MLLSDLAKIFSDLKVIRDSEFDLLGMITTSYTHEKVLAYITDEKYIDSIQKNSNITSLIVSPDKYELVKKFDIGVIINDNPKKVVLCYS